MCLTTKTTFTTCLHMITTTESCRTLFASLFLKCKPSNTTVYMEDFCPHCREFWDKHSISESSRRSEVRKYREAEGYQGPLTPSMARGHLGFIRNEDNEWKPVNEEGPGARTETKNLTPGYLSELNAKWGENPGSFSNTMAKSRASADSRRTLWPDAEMSRKDGNAPKLGPDEFGHDSDVASNWSRGEGVIKPEEFDLDVLEREVRTPDLEAGVGDSRLRPIAPMPAYMPQRMVKTIENQSI